MLLKLAAGFFFAQYFELAGQRMISGVTSDTPK